MLAVFQQPHAIDDDMIDPGGDRLDARPTVRKVVHQLARLVRDHHPDIGIVLATGYSEKATRAMDEGFRLIEKPYSLDAMRQSLGAVSIAATK